MKEEAAEVGSRREQADAFDVALPTQKRCSPQGRMFGAVIGVFDPGRESGVEFFQGQGLFGVEIGQELVADAPEEPFNFSAPFGLIRGRMDDNDTKRSRNPSQLRGTVDFCIIGIVTDGYTAGPDRLTEAIQSRVQSLVRIKLAMGNDAAGVVENGMKKNLHFAAAGALDVGTVQHVRLPDIIAKFRLEFLIRLGSEELALGQAALLEESVQRRRGHLGSVLSGR